MAIKVLKEKKIKNVTDSHLQVRNLNDYEQYDWSSQKIVDSLRDECNISKADAEKIANNVYKDLIDKERTEIDVPTLKNIVNYHIFKAGYNGVKLAGQINIGMSLYDMDALLREKSNENANVTHNNPEAIAHVVVENNNKKYALKKIFSHDVSTAHLEGFIHLHDLGQLKAYAESKETTLHVFFEDQNRFLTCNLEELWKIVDSKENRLNDTQTYKETPNTFVKDRGELVKLERIIKSNETKNMIEFELQNREKVKVTENHGCVVSRNQQYIIVRADEVLSTDKFIKIF